MHNQQGMLKISIAIDIKWYKKQEIGYARYIKSTRVERVESRMDVSTKAAYESKKGRIV